MNQADIIKKTAEHVKGELLGETTGHDWWHVYRVWKLAKHIAVDEQADCFVVELAAILHDIADYKFHGGDHDVGLKVSREWLEKLEVDEEVIVKVLECIAVCSFSKGEQPKTVEAAIVQDADRLEALGAIGIARAFATGTHFDQILYDPDQPKDEQKTTVGHFYEKLLKLQVQMNTEAGRRIAEARHRYVEEFLERFYDEWEGEQ